MEKFFLFLVALCLSALASTPAAAVMRAGYQLLCEKNATPCNYSGEDLVEYDAELFQTLVRVNAAVNAQIRARPDPGLDVWSIEPSAGDCEDFAMTKRLRLLNEGLPGNAMRIVVGTHPKFGPHAVLVVHTTNGSFVLDVPGIEKKVKPISSMYAAWPQLDRWPPR